MMFFLREVLDGQAVVLRSLAYENRRDDITATRKSQDFERLTLMQFDSADQLQNESAVARDRLGLLKIKQFTPVLMIATSSIPRYRALVL
jgi:hypothetical protein